MIKRIFIVAILALSLSASAQRGETQSRELEAAQGMEVMLSIYSNANLFYVDTVNPTKLVNDAMFGMLSKLDPYTEYIPKDGLSDFEFATTGKYGGVGALIRQRGEWVEISEPYFGTPSDLAGLKAGDRLLEIDGVSLEDLGSAKVSSMLKGDPNTTFTLKYRPIKDTTTTVTVDITRQKIVIPGVPYYGIVGDSIGYIRFDNFTAGGAQEVKSAYQSLIKGGKLKGLILDLRSNGGGIVGEAIDIIGMFTPKGEEVLEMRGKVKEMNSTYKTRYAPLDLEIPMVVLMSRVSASASEIVAGAFQDLDRAVIIGNRSFGKGLVQSTRDVPDGGILKMTTAKYYTPSGRCIQALDYTHRRDDGSVGHIPDTLIQEFTTKNGRKVFDGGGIMPDIKLEDVYLSKFAAIVLAYGFIDDFANIYAAHNSIAKEDFELTDKIYKEFCDFMEDKTIEYESLSSVKLGELRDAAKREKYDERIIEELDAIAAKIKDDKATELEASKEDIKELLSSAILTRMHYESASIEHSLTIDPAVKEAIAVLEDEAKYNEILTSKDTSKN